MISLSEAKKDKAFKILPEKIVHLCASRASAKVRIQQDKNQFQKNKGLKHHHS